MLTAVPTTSPAVVQIGAFVLDKPLGEGAMGEVWRAHHEDLGVAVAVKIVTTVAVDERSELLRASLRREVKAMAQLRHPNVASIIDQGVISEVVAKQSAGRFVAGSPYYVLELAAGGTLTEAIDDEQLDWPAARATLLDLLDGLAHAHAHGVVHRDLKPDNVLDFERAAPHPRHWKLVDFGIVHSMNEEHPARLQLVCGTPAYMAPEQILGEWRDFGPWTDLYALGVTAYEMVTGEQPFWSESLEGLIRQHLSAPVPEMTPMFAVPVGFSEWIMCLLQKSPLQRFPHAADARAVLLELPDPSEGEPPRVERVTKPPARAQETIDTQEAIATMLAATMEQAPLTAFEGDMGPPSESSSPTETLLAAWPINLRERATFSAGRFALPPTEMTFWTEDVDRAEAEALATSSVALVGFRAAPFVGRASERGVAWQALQRVRDSGQPEALVLEGTAGAGKSSLAAWLCRRFDEIGAAQVLAATHSQGGGSSDGLIPMLERALRCRGLDHEGVTERISNLTDASSGLAEQLAGLLIGAGSEQRAPSQNDRFLTIRDYLTLIAQERPVVLWIDDAQWGLDALGLVRFLVEHSHNPILCILTVRSEALLDAPAARDMLKELAALSTARTLRLEALSDRRMHQLIAGRLSLDPGLAKTIAKHSHGNPLYVVQLLDEWVETGVLTATDAGYVVRSGVTPELPADLHAIWAERVAHLLKGAPHGSETAIHLAALLGLEVVRTHWLSACDKAGVRASPDLVATMVEQGLAIWTDGGFRFVHGLLRDSIVRLARGPHWKQLHGWCAAALQGDERARRQIAGRLGRHLMQSGDMEAALAPLLRGAEVAFQRADVDEAFALLDLRRSILSNMGPQGVVSSVENLTLRGTICTHTGRHDDAVAYLEEAQATAEAHGLVRPLAEALLAATVHYRNYHQSERAQTLVRQALGLFESLGDASQAAWCRLHLGHILTNSASTDRTQPLYADAFAVFHTLDDRAGMAQCQRGLGWLRHAEGELDKAAEHFAHAHRLLLGLGHQVHAMQVLNDLGDLQRSRGELDEAEANYRSILELFESIGHVNGPIVRLNLVMVHLAHRNYVRAKAMLTPMLAALEHDPYLQAAVHSQLLVCAAGLADWAAWDAHFAHVQTWFREAVDVEADDALAVHQAVMLALVSSARVRGLAAVELAVDLWRRLGRPEQIAELDRAVLETPPPPPARP